MTQPEKRPPAPRARPFVGIMGGADLFCECDPKCGSKVNVEMFPGQDLVALEVDNVEIVVSLSLLRAALVNVADDGRRIYPKEARHGG